MTIDWMHFSPYSALIGGLVIGAAASLFLLLNGRIAGISGILGGLLQAPTSNVAWRIAFLAGLVLAPIVYQLFAVLPQISIDASTPLLVIAGLFVGLGTQYGAGCTSGHGVCGLSRLSPRSLVATLSFMAAGFATVFVLRHLIS
jgi:uncharacterized protein